MSDAPKNDETKAVEDETKTPEVEGTETDPIEDPEGTKVEKTEDEPKEEPKTFDEEYVQGLRNESANYRTKLREAEDKLKNVKSLEEVDELVKSITDEREKAEHQLLVENVALTHRLPKDAWKRLTGKTREELEADAKELATLLGADKDADEEDPHLEGGLSPRDRDSDPSDPAGLASKYGRRSRR